MRIQYFKGVRCHKLSQEYQLIKIHVPTFFYNNNNNDDASHLLETVRRYFGYGGMRPHFGN